MRKIFLISILLHSAVLFALPSVCLFYQSDIRPDDLSTEYRKVVYDTMYAELKALNFKMVNYQDILDQKGYDSRNLSSEQAIEVAREANAEVAVTGILLIDTEFVTFSIKAFHVSTHRILFSRIYKQQTGLDFFASVENVAIETRELLEKEISLFPWDEQRDEKGIVQLKPTILPLGTPVKVRIYSPDEGIALRDDLGKLIGVIANGYSDIYATPGSTLRLHKEKGLAKDVEEFQITENTSELYLRRIMAANGDMLDIRYTTGQLLGLGMGYHMPLVDDWQYINFSEYIYIQPPNNLSNSMIVLHSDFSINIGSYACFEPSSMFRYYVQIGAGVIFTKPFSSTQVYMDTYLNLLSQRLELTLFDIHFFLGMDIKLPLEIGPYLLDSEAYVDSFPPLTIGVFL